MDLGEWLMGTEGRFRETEALSPEQRRLLESLMGGTQERMFQPSDTYGGPYIAEPTEGQEQATDRLSNMLRDSTYSDAFNRYASGEPTTEINPEATERYFQENVARPLQEQFDETQAEVANQFAGPGTYWGGARADAQRETSADLANTLAKERANLMHQDEQARRQMEESAADRAIQAATQGGQYETGLASTLGEMGRQQQELGQRGLEQQYQEYVRTRPENQPYLEMALQALGVPVKQTAYQPGREGALGSLLEMGTTLLTGGLG